MNIKLLRLALHMNTAQAARYLAARPDHPNGVSETTWNRWENGVKTLPDDMQEHLSKIADNLAYCLDCTCQLPRADEGGVGLFYHSIQPENMSYIEYKTQLACAVYAYALGIKVVEYGKQ